jgi:hypothetical protein
MANKMKILTAELNAINHWDRVYSILPHPDQIDKDACIARFFRRIQVVAKIHEFASMN